MAKHPHEFEAREQQDSALGDLPADIGYERREHIIARGRRPHGGVGVHNPSTPGARTMPPNLPPDVRYQSRERFQTETTGRVGTMSQGATVRSMYDARPVNARDWLQGARVNLSSPNGAPFIGESTIFIVPEGYVGVLRQFRFDIFPLVMDGDSGLIDNWLWTILVGGIPVPQLSDMALGQQSEDWFDVWVLANETQTIGIRLVASVDYDLDFPQDISPRADVIMRGNILLRTGVPIEYEPGNPADMFPIVPGTQLAPGGGVAKEPPTVPVPSGGQPTPPLARKTIGLPGRQYVGARAGAPRRGAIPTARRRWFRR